MANIKVAVFDGPDFHGIKSRPLRHLTSLPNQYGVVFRQKVYRLFSLTNPDVPADWRIDIALQNYDPDNCPVAERIGPEADSSRRSQFDWYWEETPSRRYIAINGTEKDLVRFLELLTNAGLEPVNFGPSMRPASDGKVYDWYIRLPLRQGQGPSEQDVRRAIQSSTIDAPVPTKPRTDTASPKVKANSIDGGLPDELVRNILKTVEDAGLDEEFLDKLHPAATNVIKSRDQNDLIGFLEQAFKLSVSSSAELRSQLAEFTESLSSSQDDVNRLLDKVQTLEKSVDDLKSQTRQSAPSVDVDSLSSRIEELEALVDSVRQQQESAERNWLNECELREDAEAYSQGLEQRLERAQEQIRRFGGSHRVIEEILGTLVPDLQLLRDSLSVLLSFDDPIPTVELLAKLGSHDLTAGTPIGGAPGWRDLHLRTGATAGAADASRIYYRSIDGVVEVLIGVRREQTADIRWIRRRR